MRVQVPSITPCNNRWRLLGRRRSPKPLGEVRFLGAVRGGSVQRLSTSVFQTESRGSNPRHPTSEKGFVVVQGKPGTPKDTGSERSASC